MNGLTVIITTDESSKQHLLEKIEFVLALMDKEHHTAATHSQRNAYMAVARIELQALTELLRYSRTPGQRNITGDINDIPM